MEIQITKTMECRKAVLRGKLTAKKCLPQEIRKNLKKKTNFTLQDTRKRTNKAKI